MYGKKLIVIKWICLLKLLSRSFNFVSFNCHAELSILISAKDCNKFNTLYIGVSKRPCYCCSLFFKAVTENRSVPFKISIVTSHGKFYKNWKIADNLSFETEFIQVFTKIIQDKSLFIENQKYKKLLICCDETSFESGSDSNEILTGY